MKPRSLPLFLALLAFAVPAMAQGPSDLGGNSSTWQPGSVVPGSVYYENTRRENLILNFSSTQGARFTIPGKSEDKANTNSVVGDDKIHPGTQIFPGSNAPSR